MVDDRKLLSKPKTEDDNNFLVEHDRIAVANKFVKQQIIGDDVGNRNVLHVTLSKTSREIMDEWYRANEMFPDQLAIICVADSGQSTGQTVRSDSFIRYPYIAHVDSITDLDKIGTTTISLFDRWERSNNETIIDFDSIDPLLDHCEPEQVFRFLHIFKNWVNSIDGTCFYRFDVSTVDEGIVKTYRELFDVTISMNHSGPTFEMER